MIGRMLNRKTEEIPAGFRSVKVEVTKRDEKILSLSLCFLSILLLFIPLFFTHPVFSASFLPFFFFTLLFPIHSRSFGVVFSYFSRLFPWMREGRRIKTFYQQEQTDEWIGLRVIPRGGYSGNKRVGEERKAEGILEEKGRRMLPRQANSPIALTPTLHRSLQLVSNLLRAWPLPGPDYFYSVRIFTTTREEFED